MCGYGVHKALDGSATGGADILSYDAINLFLGGESLRVPGATGLTTIGTNFWIPFIEPQNTDPYGMGHLFGLHLVDRYGVAKWGELTSSSQIGLVNLHEVLGVAPEDIFHGFNIALHASSLTFMTLLSFIPTLALAISLVRAVSYDDSLRDKTKDFVRSIIVEQTKGKSAPAAATCAPRSSATARCRTRSSTSPTSTPPARRSTRRCSSTPAAPPPPSSRPSPPAAPPSFSTAPPSTTAP